MRYVFSVMAVLLSTQVFAQNKVIHIYQDADLSLHTESAIAIQQGIEVAFGEINNQIDGYQVLFKYLDHRGNVIRSKRNYRVFMQDPKALAIFSGIHSPPLIKNRAFINENKALTLVPWAAGDPITRYPSHENWVFRLSVDDAQAAPVIMNFAVNQQGCKRPHLLLEDTPWGDSNLRSMSKIVDIGAPDTTRFSWNLKSRGARTLLRSIVKQQSDCIVLVSNSLEGAVIIEELVKLPETARMPVISHWGIVGGNFHKIITPKKRKKLNLHFIQSCFAFTNASQTGFTNKVFAQLQRHSKGAIQQPRDLKPAVGFIHAYDLTKLLIQAIKQTGLTGDMTKDRDAIRLALEDLQQPVQGLIKTYIKPFSVFDGTNNNAHEALSSKDYCMGRYGENDEISVLQMSE